MTSAQGGFPCKTKKNTLDLHLGMPMGIFKHLLVLTVQMECPANYELSLIISPTIRKIVYEGLKFGFIRTTDSFLYGKPVILVDPPSINFTLMAFWY